MLTRSKNHNINYLAKIVQISRLVPIEGADRIQLAVVDFQEVVVSKDVEVGDVMVYFPIESAINSEFISSLNAFRDKDLNVDKDKTGFFDERGRVKAVKLMKGAVKSMGYLVPIESLEAFSGVTGLVTHVGEEFDTIEGELILKKYRLTRTAPSTTKDGKKPKGNRIIENQVHLHVDSEHLGRNIHKIDPSDIISITKKLHGTSATYQHVQVKKELNWYESFLQKIGVNVVDKEYDLIVTSRKVIKNKSFRKKSSQKHFYGKDVWSYMAEVYNLKEILPKGYSIYAEIVGYVPNTNSMIQGGYDYGCEAGEAEMYVYRMTYTNTDGLVTELPMRFIREFCEKVGLKSVPILHMGRADACTIYNSEIENWREKFVEALTYQYLEQKCSMSKNDVWDEGVVVKKDEMFRCNPLKLKSFNFLIGESKQLDTGEADIETEN